MRIGKIRVVFCINVEELLIYEIDFRGNIYKKKLKPHQPHNNLSYQCN